MEMPLGITIEKIEAKVRMASQRQDNILAFGELHFYPDNNVDKPIIKVKGITFRLKKFESNQEPVISVVFPAFRSAKSKTGFQTSFIIENESLLADVRKLLRDEFNEVSGGLSAKEAVVVEDIDPEEIPF